MAGQVYPDAGPQFNKMQGATVGPIPPPATYCKPRHRHHRGCCCCFFTTVCSILLAVVLVLGVAALVVWLVLRPIHAPNYTLDDLQIKSFNVTPSSSLNADFVYTITANNPNRKIGIKYDVINVETSYSGEVFGKSSIPAFYQGHQNVTTLTSEFNVQGFALTTQNSGRALAADIQSGSVPLQTRASAKVRVKIGSYTSFAVWVHVDCDVRVSPPTSSSAAKLISKSCKLTR